MRARAGSGAAQPRPLAAPGACVHRAGPPQAAEHHSYWNRPQARIKSVQSFFNCLLTQSGHVLRNRVDFLVTEPSCEHAHHGIRIIVPVTGAEGSQLCRGVPGMLS